MTLSYPIYGKAALRKYEEIELRFEVLRGEV